MVLSIESSLVTTLPELSMVASLTLPETYAGRTAANRAASRKSFMVLNGVLVENDKRQKQNERSDRRRGEEKGEAARATWTREVAVRFLLGVL